AVIATLFQFGIDWMQLLLVGVVFMIGQMVEGYILQPFLLGDKIGLSPVAVVFAVLAGAQLGGFLGMLIALPVAAVIVVLLKHARNNYERSRLYGLPSEFVLEVSNDQPVHFETQQLDIDLEGEKTQDTDTSNKTHP
ncbi:AI-2E family transporter, partial [Acinetobacter ursingii]